MNEAAYADHAQEHLGPDSVGSYLSYLRRIERELKSDVDHIDLAEHVMIEIGDNLSRRGIPKKSVTNCLSALRSYAAFKRS